MIGQPTPTWRKWLTGWRWSSRYFATSRSNRDSAGGLERGDGRNGGARSSARFPSERSFLGGGCGPRSPRDLGGDPPVDLRVLVVVERPCGRSGPSTVANSNFGELSSSWQRMQSRFLSACSAVSFIGLRNSALSGSETCFEPGPWQFSHWLPLRWGVAASDRQPEVYSKPVVWQVTHSASKIVLGLGSFSKAVEGLGVLGGAPLHERVRVAPLAGLCADVASPPRWRSRSRGGGSSRRSRPT